jgi:hypothetical protein
MDMEAKVLILKKIVVFGGADTAVKHRMRDTVNLTPDHEDRLS